MAKSKAESQNKDSALKITLTRGLVAKKDTQIRVVKALGLGKYGSSVIHFNSPIIQGMVRKVRHLVTVEPTNEKPEPKGHSRAHLAASAQ